MDLFFSFLSFFSVLFLFIDMCGIHMRMGRLAMLFYDGINFPLSQNAYGGMKSGTLAMACLNDVAANRFVCAISCLLPYVCVRVDCALFCFVIFFHPALFKTDCRRSTQKKKGRRTGIVYVTPD